MSPRANRSRRQEHRPQHPRGGCASSSRRFRRQRKCTQTQPMTEEWPSTLLPALLEIGTRIGTGTTSSAPRLVASTVVLPPGFSSHHLSRHRREVPLGEQSAESPFGHVQSFVAVRSSRWDDGCVVGTARVLPRHRPTRLLPPASTQSLRLSLIHI